MDFDYDPEFPIPTHRELEAIGKYSNIESSFMAAENFFDEPRAMQIRKLAVTTVAKYSQGGDLDAFVPYLAMNYFDRVFSRKPLPDVEGDDNDKVRLLAICCLTIAAKMRTKSFSVDQFRKDKFLDVGHEKIMKMELHILNGLDWRMRSITAFCFLENYYPLFKRIGGFKRRCINEIIVQSQGENSFTRYKPSDIALSSFLAATHIAYPSRFSTIAKPEEKTPCMYALIDLCQRKNIEIERAESGFASSSSALAATRERQSEEVVAPETETNQQRRGKAVVAADAEEKVKASTSEIIPAADATPKKLMNFELRWPIDDSVDLNIPPPLVSQETSVRLGTPTREVGNGRDAADSSGICGCKCDLL